MTAMNFKDQLQSLQETTTTLYNTDPHNPLLYLQRGHIHARLGFPDLAAADAYRALALLESVVDPEGCEYVARRRRFSPTEDGHDDDDDVVKSDEEKSEKEDEDDDENFVAVTQEEYDGCIGEVYVLLVQSLVRCGCLRDAYEFGGQGIDHLNQHQSDLRFRSSVDNAVSDLRSQINRIKEVHSRRRKGAQTVDDEAKFDPSTLTAQGYAQRVLYPWNSHEPDRKLPDTLALLNERLKVVAPRCEVKAVALPALHSNTTGKNMTNSKEEQEQEEVSIQLGLFATEDIPPGSILLRESSLLTATNRLHDDLCDACNGSLPQLDPDPTNTENRRSPVACENCFDTIFCSQSCHDTAQKVYHTAICGQQDGLESIGKEVPDPQDKADYLYLLLLGRTLAMAETQNVHPLELADIKYIWGDFHSYNPTTVIDDDSSSSSSSNGHLYGKEGESLPFSFQLSILQPFRIVEEMGLNPFTTLPRYDTWILNTLYAKFRGTASGRLSTWDGGPEVCAVHPLWCLANHSCDPNVRWEWGGEITFVVRTEDERAVWTRKGQQDRETDGAGAGIKKNEEILNHYCDIGLDVKQRREWARGALGGLCRCERCLWESSLTN